MTIEQKIQQSRQLTSKAAEAAATAAAGLERRIQEQQASRKARATAARSRAVRASREREARERVECARAVKTKMAKKQRVGAGILEAKTYMAFQNSAQRPRTLASTLAEAGLLG